MSEPPEGQRGSQFALRARERLDAKELGDAFVLFLDAARAYAVAGDPREAKRCAREALALWPTFEESKSLDMRAPSRKAEAPAKAPRLRRLPGAAPVAEAAKVPETSAGNGPTTALPSMFMEMHAEALRLAGEEKEALAQYARAQAAVEAEVSRRQAGQEWAEAFSAALSALRLAEARGASAAVEASRRSFIALAREAAREALTPEYFARGKDALPLAAIESAVEQARLLADPALAVEIDAERASVERRTREVLVELADERTAAEAILSWEDAWPHLAKNTRMREALMDAPARATDLTGPLSSLAGMAATHPARLEVQEFADRHAALIAHARARTGAAPQGPPSRR